MNEGTMWESALFCGSEKLNNLTLIIDDNHSIDAMIDIRSMEEKLKVFGFEVLSVHGHDTSELKRALLYRKDRPIAVIAETIRGYGSSTIMTDNTWFHRAPLEEELIILKKEIDDFE